MFRTSATLVFFLFALMFCGQTSAQSTQSCGNFGVTLVYVNGIDTTHTEAYSAMLKTERRYNEAPGQDMPYFGARLAYNPNVSLWADLVETFDQLPEVRGYNDWQTLSFLNRLTIVVGRRTVLPVAAVATLSREVVTRRLGSSLTDHLVAAVQRAPRSSIVSAHTDMLRNEIRLGRVPIVVAHSQGNLFALEAGTRLQSLDPLAAPFMRTIHIASPSPFSRGGRVTSSLDVVIRFTPGGCNEGCIDNAYTADYPLGHNYTAVYANPPFATNDELLVRLGEAKLLALQRRPQDSEQLCPPPPPPPIVGEPITALRYATPGPLKSVANNAGTTLPSPGVLSVDVRLSAPIPGNFTGVLTLTGGQIQSATISTPSIGSFAAVPSTASLELREGVVISYFFATPLLLDTGTVCQENLLGGYILTGTIRVAMSIGRSVQTLRNLDNAHSRCEGTTRFPPVPAFSGIGRVIYHGAEDFGGPNNWTLVR